MAENENKKITLKWFVCPNRFDNRDKDNPKLKLSVILMPELSGADHLKHFTPFLNWPQTVKDLNFELHISYKGSNIITLSNFQDYLLDDTIKDGENNYWRKIFYNTPVLSQSPFSLSDFLDEKKPIFFPSGKIFESVKQNYSLTGRVYQGQEFPDVSFYSFNRADTNPPEFFPKSIFINCTRGQSYTIKLKVKDESETWVDFKLSQGKGPKYGHLMIYNDPTDPIYKEKDRTEHEAVCIYTASQQDDSDYDSFEVLAFNTNTGKISEKNPSPERMRFGTFTVNINLFDGTPLHKLNNIDTNISSRKEIFGDIDRTSININSDLQDITHNNKPTLDKEFTLDDNDKKFELSKLALSLNNEKFMRDFLDHRSFISDEIPDTDKWNFYRLKYCHDKLKPPKQPSGNLQDSNIEKEFHDILNECTADYQNFMKYNGIVLDFEIPIKTITNFDDWLSPEGSTYKEIRISSNFKDKYGKCPDDVDDTKYVVDEKIIWTIYKLQYKPPNMHLFLPIYQDNSDGWFLFDEKDPKENPGGKHEVITLDVNDTVHKLSDFSSNISNSILYDHNKHESDTASPQNNKEFSTPSLSAGGFSIVDSEAAKKLDIQLKNLNEFHNNFNNNQECHITGEDLKVGYRIDVKDLDLDKPDWKSLCYRVGKYTFKRSNGTADPNSIYIYEEGYISVAPSSKESSSIKDPDTNYMVVSESLFKWTGWGLCMEPIGNTLGNKTIQYPGETPSTFDYPLWVTFRFRRDNSDNLPKILLPRLRFGRRYQFRMRTVDFAGNSIPSTEDEPSTSPSPNMSYIIPKDNDGIKYLRYEPVAAPVIVLRKKLESPGESVDDIVIHTSPDPDIVNVSERHIAPPAISKDMAEKHGLFDKLKTRDDMKKAYKYLVEEKDGTLRSEPYTDPNLILPYLHDPIVKGVAFHGLPNSINGVDLFEFKESYFRNNDKILWKERLPFRLVLEKFDYGEPGDTDETIREKNKPKRDNNLVRVRLKPGHVADVKISCYLEDGRKNEMALYKWIEESLLTDNSKLDFTSNVANGTHWMITPYHPIRLINAVQIPSPVEIKDRIEATERANGDTAIILKNKDEITVDGLSTQKVVIKASWCEQIESESISTDGVKTFSSEEVPCEAIAFEINIEDKEKKTLEINHKHEFHDTKYHKVKYKSIAISRFKDFYTEKWKKDNGEIIPRKFESESDSQEINVLNTVRPQSPKVLYPNTIFKWIDSIDNTTGKIIRKRSGGGIRIYLDRPFYSSGEGELLGIVLPEYEAEEIDPESSNFKNIKKYVTLWGKDPISKSGPLSKQKISPSISDFKNMANIAYPKEGEPRIKFSLEELKEDGHPDLTIAVVGFPVNFESETGRYYSDIEISPGSAYFPFVNLKLVSFQKNSIPEAECSRVVHPSFVQLTPDRYASFLFDDQDDKKITVYVSGFTDEAKVDVEKIKISAKIEVEIEGTELNDHEDTIPYINSIPWKTDAEDITFDLESSTNEKIWKKVITLPYKIDKCRLLLQEVDLFFGQLNSKDLEPRMIWSTTVKLKELKGLK